MGDRDIRGIFRVEVEKEIHQVLTVLTFIIKGKNNRESLSLIKIIVLLLSVSFGVFSRVEV